MESAISPKTLHPKKSSMDSLLKPPNSGLIKKVGPAETGHLTPRSRSASRSSTCSTSNLQTPASPSSGSDLPGSSGGGGLGARPSGITFERSRSSGRLAVSSENGGAGELKRGAASAASTSVLANLSSSSSGVAGGLGGQTVSKTSLATTCAATTSSLSTIQSNGGSKPAAVTVESANVRSKGQPAAAASVSPLASSSTSSSAERHKKSIKILQQWRKKTSMSKLGKGTRSLVCSTPINQVSSALSARWYQMFSISLLELGTSHAQFLIGNGLEIFFVFQLGKWKSHSQSVDATTPQNPVAKGICPMSDSLDGGIGHASDPGSIDGQVFGVEKSSTGAAASTANGTTANTKKNAKAAKNQSRQSSQANAVTEEKPKYSWSEHVWSKYIHLINFQLSVEKKPIFLKSQEGNEIPR